MKWFCGAFLLFLLFLSCRNDDTLESLSGQNPNSEEPVNENPTSENTANLLLQLDGTQIVDANKNPVYLQGVAFNNFIWSNTPIPEEHHNELDYKRVKDMGMNTIRFYMNYSFFEDDSSPYTYRQSGWDWLDQNIAWAKKNDVYLILNMHTPQGGYQSQGEGNALWNDVENQNRLVALWKAIAERYKDEVQIAGFGPVNEPVPSRSMQQWSDLAQRLIDEIRAVNKHHLLFIEKVIYVKGNFSADENLNFPVVTGTNLVYEFHGYEPYFYTHQLMDFTNLGDGGKYPDENKIETSNTEWYTATLDNPSLAVGSTDWVFFEGIRYKITDDNIDLAAPALVGAEVGGKVYFDDITIKEYDESGQFVQNILELNLDTADRWFYWSRDESGSSGLSSTEGREDSKSLFIEGANADCNLTNTNVSFIPKMNYSYQIDGWMKGENVVANASCQIRLDFYKASGPILRRDKAYLESDIMTVNAWAKSKNAALYMGEFGVGYPCFQDNKGGLQWVADMVTILKTNNVHFTYHAYHEDNFGLYLGDGLPDPSNVNQPLIDWFTDNLK